MNVDTKGVKCERSLTSMQFCEGGNDLISSLSLTRRSVNPPVSQKEDSLSSTTGEGATNSTESFADVAAGVKTYEIPSCNDGDLGTLTFSCASSSSMFFARRIDNQPCNSVKKSSKSKQRPSSLRGLSFTRKKRSET